MKPIFLFLLSLTSYVLFGQYYTLTEVSMIHSINKTGDPLDHRENIEGTPFLEPQWYPGEIYFQGNKMVRVDEINFQAAQQKFYFRKDNQYYEVYPDKVDRIVILDPKKGKRIFVPKLSYPFPFSYHYSYFEIFDSPDKAYVIVGYAKKLEPKNRSQSYASDNSSETMKYYGKKRIFVLVNNVYVKRPSNLKKLLRLTGVSPTLRKEVLQYARKNHLKFSKPAALQKIMAYLYARRETSPPAGQ